MAQPRKKSIIRNLDKQWEKALRCSVVAAEGKDYRIATTRRRSDGSPIVYNVNLADKTCDCAWMLPGCAHMITAAVHYYNNNGFFVKLATSWLVNINEDGMRGKGDADYQFVFDNSGIKLLLYQLPKDHAVDQLAGDVQPQDLFSTASSTDDPPAPDKTPWADDFEKFLSLSWNSRQVTAYNWAMTYLKAGFSICALPNHKTIKHPVIPWSQYQHTAPSAQQVEKWFGAGGTGRLCIITGYQGLYVLDFDNNTVFGRFWQQMSEIDASYYQRLYDQVGMVKTGRGVHVYFKMHTPPGNESFAKIYHRNPDGSIKTNDRNQLLHDVAISGRGSGGLVVAPPSLHYSDRRYKWLSDFTNLPTVPNERYAEMQQVLYGLGESPVTVTRDDIDDLENVLF